MALQDQIEKYMPRLQALMLFACAAFGAEGAFADDGAGTGVAGAEAAMTSASTSGSTSGDNAAVGELGASSSALGTGATAAVAAEWSAESSADAGGQPGFRAVVALRRDAFGLDWPAGGAGEAQNMVVGQRALGVSASADAESWASYSAVTLGAGGRSQFDEATALFAPWAVGASLGEATADQLATMSFNSTGRWQSNSTLGRFDVAVTPRANVGFDNATGSSGVSGGALVRLGDSLVSSGPVDQTWAWFLFVGADAQALTWRPSSSDLIVDGGIALRDMVILGDLQAGMAWHYGMADIALAYVYREYSAVAEYGAETIKMREQEDFVGLSISWEY